MGSWFSLQSNLSDYLIYWEDTLDDNMIDNATFRFCNKDNIRHVISILIPFMYWLAFIIGALGNSLVILVYWFCTRIKTMTDMFLLNMAIADLLFTCTLPFWAIAIADQWKFHNLACKVVSSMYKMNFYCFVLLIACISWDRYLAIAQATKEWTPRWRSLKKSKIICFIVWGLAISSSLPEILYSEVKELSNISICTSVYPKNKNPKLKSIILILRESLGLILPFVIMICCYAIVIHTLIQAKKSPRRQALKIIIIVLTNFVLSQFPYNCVLLVQALDANIYFISSCELSIEMDKILQSTQVMAFLHSCANPIFYLILGRRFRQDICKILRKLSCFPQTQCVLFSWRQSSSSTSSMCPTETTVFQSHPFRKTS
ncbi:PREDICTED: C-C chemokine receptor type 9 [Condylura cristata]|uniref:C-C chemokine receptor type 9 n=1 Tax=Condylura cristata TaxID=143302 RepID=UPI000334758E|nr:PREDICTED: C-C chemokine receptor type 9 [Condylura cristata]